MKQTHKEKELDPNDEIKCFECHQICPCKCFEIDTDYGLIYFCSRNCYNTNSKKYGWDNEFGNYEGHYANCEYGGHFKEKWLDLRKQENVFEKLYFKTHKDWREQKEALASQKVEYDKEISELKSQLSKAQGIQFKEQHGISKSQRVSPRKDKEGREIKSSNWFEPQTEKDKK